MASVEVSVDGNIATITMNRPEALNALSSAVLEDLEGALDRIEGDAQVRGVILTGAGRSFVAGADIEEIAALGPESALAFARRGQRVMSRIEALEVPVVAAVNGFALGGGCELALACHMRVAASSARFGQPEVRLGIPPGFGGTQRLPRLIGRGLASELLLTGRQVRADEALRIGLANQVVEPDALLESARALLEKTFENGPQAVAASLRAVREGIDQPLEAALEVEAQLFAAACGTPEMREGTGAFLEKRAPSFARSS